MKHLVISFSILISCLLILFQLSRFSRWQSPDNTEWWLIFFCILFLCAGIVISKKFFPPSQSKPADPPISDTSDAAVEKLAVPDQHTEIIIKRLGISTREYEVLHLVSEGLSNQQIAARLFVSENTIKKHISSLFLKLDVQRRTEAVRKGIELKILPPTLTGKRGS